MDGFGSHLFNLKKVLFPPLPFYVGSYKFSKVKSAPEFIKELECFILVKRDFTGMIPKAGYFKVNFEYVDYVEKGEEMYRDV